MATRSNSTLRALGAAALLTLGACSSGTDIVPPTIDLTGFWQFYMTPAGGEETGPSAVLLTQTGATIDGAAITGTVSGNTFSIYSTVIGLGTLHVYGALVGNTATGTLSVTGLITMTGTFRMVGFAPTGTLTASGTIDGVNVAIDTTTAIGSRDYLDQGLTALAEVELVAAVGTEHLELTFAPAGLATGALAVPGTVAVTVTWRDDTNTFEQDAIGGTVTVTTYDATGFSGSFSLTLPNGGTLTGTFAVSWDINAYEP